MPPEAGNVAFGGSTVTTDIFQTEMREIVGNWKKVNCDKCVKINGAKFHGEQIKQLFKQFCSVVSRLTVLLAMVSHVCRL